MNICPSHGPYFARPFFILKTDTLHTLYIFYILCFDGRCFYLYIDVSWLAVLAVTFFLLCLLLLLCTEHRTPNSLYVLLGNKVNADSDSDKVLSLWFAVIKRMLHWLASEPWRAQMCSAGEMSREKSGSNVHILDPMPRPIGTILQFNRLILSGFCQ